MPRMAFIMVLLAVLCAAMPVRAGEAGEGTMAVTSSVDNWQFHELRQVTVHLAIGVPVEEPWWVPDYTWLAIGSLRREYASGRRLSAGVSWRFHPVESSCWFVDLGFAPSYLTHHRYPHSSITRDDLGSHVQFATRLASGWMMSDSLGVFIQYEHLSNGGFWRVNPGTDQLGIGVLVSL